MQCKRRLWPDGIGSKPLQTTAMLDLNAWPARFEWTDEQLYVICCVRACGIFPLQSSVTGAAHGTRSYQGHIPGGKIITWAHHDSIESTNHHRLSSAPSSPLLCCLLSWPFTRPDDYREDGKRGNRKWMIDKMANEIGWLVNSSKNITTTLTARLHSREYYYYITLPTFFPARFSAQLDQCSEPGYTAHISLRCSARLVVKRLD
jgi:hypothetical protein